PAFTVVTASTLTASPEMVLLTSSTSLPVPSWRSSFSNPVWVTRPSVMRVMPVTTDPPGAGASGHAATVTKVIVYWDAHPASPASVPLYAMAQRPPALLTSTLPAPRIDSRA